MGDLYENKAGNSYRHFGTGKTPELNEILFFYHNYFFFSLKKNS
jgi:hypothetical protein